MPTTAIIFDITGVLLKENKIKLIKKIGLKRLVKYLVRHRTNPITTCLNTLAAIQRLEAETQPHQLMYKQRPMPQCTTDWQRGIISHDNVIQELNKHSATLAERGFFASKQEEEFVRHMLATVLNAQYLVNLLKPIKRTIRIVRKLRTKGAVKLYVLSNMGQEPFDLLIKKYSKIFGLFDDIIVSAETTFIKPEPMIFDHLCSKHNLRPTDCVFIDDQEENIATARRMGMHALLFKKSSLLRKQLHQLKLL